MRTTLTALLLTSAALLALAPAAEATSSCQLTPYPRPTWDQTWFFTCGAVDWLLIGGPSPIGTGVDYASCYVGEEPILSWVPDCT